VQREHGLELVEARGAPSTSSWSASILSVTTSICELRTPSRSRAAWIFFSSAPIRPSTICFRSERVLPGRRASARRARGRPEQADAEA
jgi:hypothetical protein